MLAIDKLDDAGNRQLVYLDAYNYRILATPNLLEVECLQVESRPSNPKPLNP